MIQIPPMMCLSRSTVLRKRFLELVQLEEASDRTVPLLPQSLVYFQRVCRNAIRAHILCGDDVVRKSNQRRSDGTLHVQGCLALALDALVPLRVTRLRSDSCVSDFSG